MKPYREKKLRNDSGDQVEDSVSVEASDREYSAKPSTATASADTFVIGTAAVHPVAQNADVCFRAVTGIDATARELTRFMAESYNRGETSYWHVFYRVSSDRSQVFIDQLQRQYDETVAYRNQLMQQYGARTIRRC